MTSEKLLRSELENSKQASLTLSAWRKDVFEKARQEKKSTKEVMDKNLIKYREELIDQSYSQYFAVEDVLWEFSKKLNEELISHKKVKQWYKLGCNVKVGQQFIIGLKIKKYKSSHIIVKAYVPKTGFPVVLKFFGKQVVLYNKEDLLKQLYVEIPSNPDVMSRLRAILACAM